jgi:glycosyltransferase involved in cell wall biosynthesis
MAESNATVSVVVPTYNRAAYLAGCLESVFAQGKVVREVIVVDDGSPDDTAERVAPLARAGRIRYVRQPNAGLAAARNTGASCASGTYLYFLDDDDLAYPGAVRALVDELERHPAAAMAYGDVRPFRGEPAAPVPSGGAAAPIPAGEPAPPATSPSDYGAVDYRRFLSFNRIWSAGQVLIRRDAFDAVGGFVAALKKVEDWDLWLRLLARYPGRAIPTPVLAYRLHGANMSSNVDGMYRYSLRVARRHIPGLPAERRSLQRAFTYIQLRSHHAPLLVQQVRREVRAGAWRRAAAAAGTLALAIGLDLGARVGLKAHLVRRGRWRPPADELAVQLR